MWLRSLASSLDLELSATPVATLVVPPDGVLSLCAHKHGHVAALFRRLRELDLGF